MTSAEPTTNVFLMIVMSLKQVYMKMETVGHRDQNVIHQVIVTEIPDMDSIAHRGKEHAEKGRREYATGMTIQEDCGVPGHQPVPVDLTRTARSFAVNVDKLTPDVPRTTILLYFFKNMLYLFFI